MIYWQKWRCYRFMVALVLMQKTRMKIAHAPHILATVFQVAAAHHVEVVHAVEVHAVDLPVGQEILAVVVATLRIFLLTARDISSKFDNDKETACGFLVITDA